MSINNYESGYKWLCLIESSMDESVENLKRASRNATAKTEDLEPYDNTALCRLVDGVDGVDGVLASDKKLSEDYRIKKINEEIRLYMNSGKSLGDFVRESVLKEYSETGDELLEEMASEIFAERL